MNYQTKIDLIKSEGFTLVDQFLSREDIDYLSSYIDNLYKSNDGVNTTSDTTPVVQDLIGKDQNFDLIIEKIISNEIFDNIAKSLLGSNYKIWEISSRISIGSDSGLSMHQDSPGQMNFWLLLNDQKSKSGVTAFFPKSHILPRLANKISWSAILISKYFLRPLLGKKGEYAFFINRCWHARLPNHLKIQNKTLAIGMFAEGSSFVPKLSNKKILKEILPNLHKRLSYEEGYFKKDRFYINNSGNNNYVMMIESFKNFNFNTHSIKVLFLHLIFFPIIIIKKLRSIFKTILNRV